MRAEQGVVARLLRVLAFFHKELVSVFRQPRLLLTLVVGPFLILLIFGLGYRDRQPPFRTLLVLGSERAELAADPESLSEAFGDGITFKGTTTDLEAARASLAAGDVDLLIVAPERPIESLDSGERALFEVIHGEVDPVVRSAIFLLAELSVDEINRRVLAEVVSVAQAEAEQAEDPVASLQSGAADLVAALESGDQASAQEDVESLRGLLEQARQVSGANGLYAAVAAALGSQNEDVLATMQDAVDRAERGDQEQALAAAREFEEAANTLGAGITEAQRLEPELLVKPFGVEVTQLNDISSEPGAYYSPGTLIVLIQHLAVTFAALSLVRERQVGLTDVFRVSPLSPGEAVTGKYLGFGTISAGVAVVLSAAMWIFGVQIRGSIAQYAVVIVVLIVASLGLGFALSGLSRTDTQAVQYSMLVLLVSIFFTGFVLPLDRLAGPVQLISYLIPATYGIRAIHDIVFRGVAVDPRVLAGLVAYALAFAVVAWWAVRRDVELARS